MLFRSVKQKGYEVALTFMICSSLRRFLSTSSSIISDAVRFIDLIIEESLLMLKRVGFDDSFLSNVSSKGFKSVKSDDMLLKLLNSDCPSPSPAFIEKIDKARFNFTQLLAQRELTKQLDDIRKGKITESSLTQFIDSLRRDIHKPSSALLLDRLVSMSGNIRSYVEAMGSREHDFYDVATKKLGIQVLMD